MPYVRESTAESAQIGDVAYVIPLKLLNLVMVNSSSLSHSHPTTACDMNHMKISSLPIVKLELIHQVSFAFLSRQLKVSLSLKPAS